MNDAVKIIPKFKKTDMSSYPDFYSYQKPLERGLWILWVAKDNLGVKKLTAEGIALIIRDVKEVSAKAISFTNSFNRAKDKVHIYQEGDKASYEIMKPGKEHLISLKKEEYINVFYFEPEKRYTSKRILSKEILHSLKGAIRIVDPYCGERALDVLKDQKHPDIKFLTKIDNLKGNNRNRFLRELKDFKPENLKIEFRDYPHADIHDRYIISTDNLVILGHSIKDLGGKESFAIVLDKATNKNIFEAMIENFNRRWKQSTVL